MSTDWFLYSPSAKREVMIGSNGFSGVQSFPASPEVVDFVRWAIDENITDIIMIDEYRLFILKDGSQPSDSGS